VADRSSYFLDRSCEVVDRSGKNLDRSCTDPDRSSCFPDRSAPNLDRSAHIPDRSPPAAAHDQAPLMLIELNDCRVSRYFECYCSPFVVSTFDMQALAKYLFETLVCIGNTYPK